MDFENIRESGWEEESEDEEKISKDDSSGEDEIEDEEEILKDSFSCEDEENKGVEKEDEEKREIVSENKKIAKENDNVIFIGSKPLVNYIRGIIMQFMKHNASEVIVKARGKFISKAVDAVEVAKRSLTEKNVQIKNIQIGSESFETDGKRTNISTIDIAMIG